MRTPLLLIGSALAVFGADLHVSSTTGSDANDGSSGAPFATIQKAATVVDPGDTVIIQSGTYREEITVTRSGTAAQPIKFVPAPGALVTISGMDLVTPGIGGMGTWQNVNGNIYGLQLPGGATTTGEEVMVAIDDIMQAEARWPNGTQAVDFDWTRYATAETGSVDPNSGGAQPPLSGTDFFTGTYTDPGFPFSLEQIAGSFINLSARQGVRVDTGVVTNVDGDTLTFRYRYHPIFPADADDPYLLWNNLDFLDVEGESFLDRLGVDGPANTLYIWNPDGGPPASRKVEFRARHNGLILDGCSHLQFKGLSFVAAGIITEEDSSDCSFEEIDCQHGGFGLNRLIGHGDMVRMMGSDHRLFNSRLQHSFGGGIQVEGSNNRVENNVFGNVAAYGVRTWLNQGATIDQNTIYDTEGRNIQINGGSSTYTRNHCYRAGLLLSDQASINSIHRDDLLDSEIAYNWAHTNIARKSPIWLGGGGIRIAGAASNVIVHHNLVWNHTNRSSLKLRAVHHSYPNFGDSKVRVYNNTFLQDVSVQNSENSGTSDITGFDFRNNICAKLTDDGAPNFSPSMAQNNVFLQNSFAGITGNTVGGMTFVSGATGNLYPHHDSPLLNTGQLIPPYTDGFSGAGPELGALEFETPNGKPWIAGALILEKDLPTLTVTPVTSPRGVTRYRLDGIPTGRGIPELFQLKIGTAPASSDFRFEYHVLQHRATPSFVVDTGGLTGSQPVSVSLDGLSFTSTVTNVTIPAPAGFSLSSVTPTNPNPAGGTVHTITGERFADVDQFSLPIAINHSSPGDFNEIPVAAVVDTAGPISSGRMKADGGDIRLMRWETNTPLEYWIESGLNTESTVLWVKHPENLLNNRFSHHDESTLYLTYGDPALTSQSDQAVASSYFRFFDHPNLVLWLSSNSLATQPDGTAVATWPRLIPRGNSGAQPTAANQPEIRKDQWNGLPAVRFSGSQWISAGDLSPDSPPIMSYLVFYRPAVPPGGPQDPSDDLNRVLSSREENGAECFNSSVLGGAPEWTTKSIRRGGKSLLDFTIGRRANSGFNFSGEIAEVVFFDSDLPSGNPTTEFDGLRDYMDRKYGVEGTFSSRGLGNSAETLFPPTIRVGNTLATIVTRLDATTLQFTAPPGSPGTAHQLHVQIGAFSDTLDPGLSYGMGTLTYADWATSFTPAVGGPTEHSDADLFVNLLDYVQDLNGIEADGQLGPSLSSRMLPSPAFVFRFRENTLMNDSEILVQTSTNLQDWSVPQPHGALGSTVPIPDPDGDGSARIIEIVFPPTQTPFFVRLSPVLQIP